MKRLKYLGVVMILVFILSLGITGCAPSGALRDSTIDQVKELLDQYEDFIFLRVRYSRLEKLHVDYTMRVYQGIDEEELFQMIDDLIDHTVYSEEHQEFINGFSESRDIVSGFTIEKYSDSDVSDVYYIELSDEEDTDMWKSDALGYFKSVPKPEPDFKVTILVEHKSVGTTSEEVLFTDDDVEFIDWKLQEYYFMPEYLEKNGKALEDPLLGFELLDISNAKNFKVYVGGEFVYEGEFFQPVFSSYLAKGYVMDDYMNGIVILDNRLDEEKDGEDLRFDDRIFEVFKDKMIE